MRAQRGKKPEYNLENPPGWRSTEMSVVDGRVHPVISPCIIVLIVSNGCVREAATKPATRTNGGMREIRQPEGLCARCY